MYKVSAKFERVNWGPLVEYIYIYNIYKYIISYCLDGHSSIEDWDFVIFEQWETHAQLKERETFWQHRLKTFYPIGLNEKDEYLY